MAKRIVRNIKDTNLREEKGRVEPFNTSSQNDLLSDDEDVFVRNKMEYHCLTDNIKVVNSTNDVTKVDVVSKNEINITTKETEIIPTSTNVDILNNDTNHFFISVTDDYVNSGSAYIDVTNKMQENTRIFSVSLDYGELYNDIADQLKLDVIDIIKFANTSNPYINLAFYEEETEEGNPTYRLKGIVNSIYIANEETFILEYLESLDEEGGYYIGNIQNKTKEHYGYVDTQLIDIVLTDQQYDSIINNPFPLKFRLKFKLRDGNDKFVESATFEIPVIKEEEE